MKQLWMDWQTFAEDAEAGQETGGETGGQAAPDAGEQEAFSALIRGQYKEQFDARVQKFWTGGCGDCGRRTHGCARRCRRGGNPRPARCCACRRRRDASGRCILISTGGGRWHHPGSGDW